MSNCKKKTRVLRVSSPPRATTQWQLNVLITAAPKMPSRGVRASELAPAFQVLDLGQHRKRHNLRAHDLNGLLPNGYTDIPLPRLVSLEEPLNTCVRCSILSVSGKCKELQPLASSQLLHCRILVCHHLVEVTLQILLREASTCETIRKAQKHFRPPKSNNLPLSLNNQTRFGCSSARKSGKLKRVLLLLFCFCHPVILLNLAARLRYL